MFINPQQFHTYHISIPKVAKTALFCKNSPKKTPPAWLQFP